MTYCSNGVAPVHQCISAPEQWALHHAPLPPWWRWRRVWLTLAIWHHLHMLPQSTSSNWCSEKSFDALQCCSNMPDTCNVFIRITSNNKPILTGLDILHDLFNHHIWVISKIWASYRWNTIPVFCRLARSTMRVNWGQTGGPVKCLCLQTKWGKTALGADVCETPCKWYGTQRLQ